MASSSAPRTLDHYRLLVLLGEGGMGEVWAARDITAPGQRIVALKTTKQDGQEAAKVLFDEARIASLIEHPNVCRVHELGRALGVQYLVMDWCDGASLFDLLQAQPNKAISIGVAVKIVSEVALGLHAAHELVDENGASMHVVHRDVSPQNVLISTQGHVSIADFGVAKARGQVHQATVTGEVKGKLSYMAPEQVRSKHVDHRADIFALGCVLYLAALGKRPFAGGDTIALMYQILEARIQTPREVDPSFPVSLESLLMRALAKDPNDRYSTALEFHRALEDWLISEGRRVTSRDVALLMDHSLGTKIRTRNARIRAAAQDEADGGADASLEERTLADLPGSITNGTGTLTRTALESSAPKAQARLRWPLLTGAAVLLAASVALALRGKLGNPAHSAALPNVAPPVASPASPSASASPDPDGTSNIAPSPVRLTVHTIPTDARISLGGLEVGRGSFERFALAKSGEQLLVVEATGYARLERSVRLDRDQELTLSLEREATVKRPKVPGTRVSPASAGDPTRSPTSTPAPAGSSGTVPKVEKRPRPIDMKNPFADGN